MRSVSREFFSSIPYCFVSFFVRSGTCCTWTLTCTEGNSDEDEKYFGATLDKLVAEGAGAMQPIRPEFKLGNDCRFSGDFFGDSTTNATVRRRSFTGWRSLPYDPVSNLWWSLSNRSCEKFPQRSWNLEVMANKCWFKCPVFFLLLVSAFVTVSISGKFACPVAFRLAHRWLDTHFCNFHFCNPLVLLPNQVLSTNQDSYS